MSMKFLALIVLVLLAMPVYAIEFGTNISSVHSLRKDGAKINYGVFWVGAWMDKYGWNGYEEALEKAKLENVTPVIVWFYWGDQISPGNVESENVYDPIHTVYKSKSRWYSMASELAEITSKHMGNKKVIIIVENEFNKNGIENYPKFNEYMLDQKNIFKSKLNADLVVGFGDWYHEGWLNFKKTVDNYDYIGFQLMRASTRNTKSDFENIPASITSTLVFIKSNFNKSSIIYDVAISSYPEHEYEKEQKIALQDFLSQYKSYENEGLKIIIYREVLDNNDMSEQEYFGRAERFWGLQRIDGSKKSSYQTFVSYTNNKLENTNITSSTDSQNQVEKKDIRQSSVVEESSKLDVTPPTISKKVETWFLEFVYKLLHR